MAVTTITVQIRQVWLLYLVCT